MTRESAEFSETDINGHMLRKKKNIIESLQEDDLKKKPGRPKVIDYYFNTII